MHELKRANAIYHINQIQLIKMGFVCYQMINKVEEASSWVDEKENFLTSYCAKGCEATPRSHCERRRINNKSHTSYHHRKRLFTHLIIQENEIHLNENECHSGGGS